MPTGSSLVQSLTATYIPGTYKQTVTIYTNSAICTGASTQINSSISINDCAPPDEDYLQYGMYRYPKAFSSQISAIIFASSIPASSAKGVTLNFYRKSTDCQASAPVSNQINIATGTCMPTPAQTQAATSPQTQYYTIFSVYIYS